LPNGFSVFTNRYSTLPLHRCLSRDSAFPSHPESHSFTFNGGVRASAQCLDWKAFYYLVRLLPTISTLKSDALFSFYLTFPTTHHPLSPLHQDLPQHANHHNPQPFECHGRRVCSRSKCASQPSSERVLLLPFAAPLSRELSISVPVPATEVPQPAEALRIPAIPSIQRLHTSLRLPSYSTSLLCTTPRSSTLVPPARRLRQLHSQLTGAF
jgi:hypothetical protein